MSRLATPAPRRLSGRTTTSYGFGSVAYGVKDAGFGTFLLIFYNQVVGLDASTVGFVIFLALVCDAFVDPLIGVLSDRTQGRWGRRHPWMYAAALPIGIGWLLLWNPPHMSSGATLAWLFVTAVIVRSAVSCYEVPSQALTPELTADYDERTRITSYRYLFGWAGGLAILLLAYGVFLTPSAAYPNGLLNRIGYGHLAIASAGIMVVAILASALGTHHEIARLPKTVVTSQTLGEHFRELWETVKNPGFLILMLAGICAYTNQGVSYALSNYFYNFVWQFQPWTLRLLPFALMLGAGLAFFIAPAVGKRTSKPRAAMAFVLSATLLNTLPYLLRFAGVLPPPGSSALVAVLLPLSVVATAFSVSSFILGASMMADVVEDSEARTGRRSEGVYFAGSFFVQKCTSGLGIMVVGQLLDLVAFPKGARAGLVPMAVLDHLTLAFVLIYATLALLAALLFAKFPFGRHEHEARLARMLAASEAEGAPHSP